VDRKGWKTRQKFRFFPLCAFGRLAKRGVFRRRWKGALGWGSRVRIPPGSNDLFGLIKSGKGFLEAGKPILRFIWFFWNA